MSSHTHAALVLIHLAGAIVWLGGMVFAHFALRPAAMQVLEPPARLALMARARGLFFRLVVGAVAALLVSGGLLLAPVGLAQAPLGWHVMLALGLVMTIVFTFILVRLHPAMRAAVAAQQWQAAADVLQRIRGLVLVNLCLGFVTVAAAVLARV